MNLLVWIVIDNSVKGANAEAFGSLQKAEDYVLSQDNNRLVILEKVIR